MADWDDYLDATRRLGVAAPIPAEAAAAHQRRIVTLSDQALTQREELAEQAGRLRLPAPDFSAAGPGEVPDLLDPVPVADRLGRAEQRLRDAARSGAEVDRLAASPPLLPSWRPRPRAAVVYAACSFAGLVGQLVLISVASRRGILGQISVYGWTCCGFPLLAFLVGVLLVGLVCRPRAGGAVQRTPRLGALICLASLPVYVLVAAAAGMLF
ncbi:hypothetical protein Athai_12710 [Actinocatenispora thailandica]|uniref:Uncharacterized protein n=1 Tax=Actinocatenispora thailandica TaxID=227318 RepID=A0A7R7HVH3_9ACTN|nr:hypothetical protein [Actinocatenispora thailandica]BCJ33768.1 hypothetical protein Athai_12710 [Actinocatenispora thailandica]